MYFTSCGHGAPLPQTNHTINNRFSSLGLQYPLTVLQLKREAQMNNNNF